MCRGDGASLRTSRPKLEARRSPGRGQRAGADTEAALTLVRVSGHPRSRGRLMPGERTGVQGPGRRRRLSQLRPSASAGRKRRVCSSVGPPRGRRPLLPTRPVSQDLWMVAEEALSLPKAPVSENGLGHHTWSLRFSTDSGVRRGPPRSWAFLPRSSFSGRSLVGGHLQEDRAVPPCLRPKSAHSALLFGN